MPLALVLGFTLGMGVRGFWLGFTCALLLQDIIVSLIVVCTNWSEVKTSEDEDEVQLIDKRALVNSSFRSDDSYSRMKV